MGGAMGSNVRGTWWLQVYDMDSMGEDGRRGQGSAQPGHKAQTWGETCMEHWWNTWVRTGAEPGRMHGA